MNSVRSNNLVLNKENRQYNNNKIIKHNKININDWQQSDEPVPSRMHDQRV